MDAWILRLKDEFKQDYQKGEEYYFGDYYVTKELNEIEIIKDKNDFIEWMKWHEKTMYEKYGSDAICNFGYTKMMERFEFVEVEVIEPE